MKTAITNETFEAIVLGSRRLKEQDRIVMFLAKGYGRFDAVAYGGHKSSSRWAGKLEPFTVLNVSCQRKGNSGLWIAKEAEVLEQYHPEDDWRRFIILQAAAELSILATPSEGMESETYEVCIGFGASVMKNEEPLAVLLAYVFHWSWRSGFGLPDMNVNERMRQFMEHAVVNGPDSWARYKFKDKKVAMQLLTAARNHVEECTEREWKSGAMLNRVL